MNIILEKQDAVIGRDELQAALIQSLTGRSFSRVLLIPPDITRLNSGGGLIANLYYNLLKDVAEVDIMPALGTHYPLTEEELKSFYGEDIPLSAYLVHNWKTDVIQIGTVPADFVNSVSGGLMNEDIPVEVNHRLFDGGYDLILSIGQVIPPRGHRYGQLLQKHIRGLRGQHAHQ